MPAESPNSWVVFSHLQKNYDPVSADLALAREEALDEVLNEITLNPTISEERLVRRFRSLCRNRRSKQSHRRYLEQKRCRPCCRRNGRYVTGMPPDPFTSDVFESVAIAELLVLVRRALAVDDFQLLWEIAVGVSYCDAARERGVSVPCLKARLFRIRNQVRMSAIGPVVCAALQQT